MCEPEEAASVSIQETPHIEHSYTLYPFSPHVAALEYIFFAVFVPYFVLQVQLFFVVEKFTSALHVEHFAYHAFAEAFQYIVFTFIL